MDTSFKTYGKQRYCIRVEGLLPKSWSSHLDETTISIERAPNKKPTTILTISVVDQAALRGILTALWDMNLKLISIVPAE